MIELWAIVGLLTIGGGLACLIAIVAVYSIICEYN